MKKKTYIYLVGPVECDYDEFDSFVIISTSPAKAREIAYKESNQQFGFKKCKVTNIGASRLKEQNVLGSFNAG